MSAADGRAGPASASWVDDALILLVLLASSRAAFVNQTDALLVVTFGAALGVWLWRGGRVTLAAIGLCLAFVLWISVHALVAHQTDWRTVAGHFLRLLVAVFVTGAVADPLARVARWVVRLAALGLVLHLACLVFDGLPALAHDLAPEALRWRGGTPVGDAITGSWRRASWLVWTVSPDRPTQNHGFMWEPAAFGMVTAMALWARILTGRHRFDRANVTLLAAMVSTLSTTAMVALLPTVAAMLMLSGARARAALAALGPALLLGILSLDFVGPKIVAEIRARDDVELRWSLSRAASFRLDLEEFRAAPVLGTGLVAEARPLAGARLPSNNGLSDFVARHGLVMSALWGWVLVTGLRRRFQGRPALRWGFLLVMALFAWSEKFLELPLFHLWLLAGLGPAVPPGQGTGAAVARRAAVPVTAR